MNELEELARTMDLRAEVCEEMRWTKTAKARRAVAAALRELDRWRRANLAADLLGTFRGDHGSPNDPDHFENLGDGIVLAESMKATDAAIAAWKGVSQAPPPSAPPTGERTS